MRTSEYPSKMKSWKFYMFMVCTIATFLYGFIAQYKQYRKTVLKKEGLSLLIGRKGIYPSVRKSLLPDSSDRYVNLEDCETLVQRYRDTVITTDSLEEVLDRCQERLADGVFVPEFLNETLGDFEDRCPKQAMFLPKPRPLVALASYPGSGNTWNRELIETVTGFYTGSVYTDWNFNGSKECPSQGKVFIIKTHLVNNGTVFHSDCYKRGVKELNYSKAVLIVRNPYDALLAEFNRQVSLSRKSDDNPGVGLAEKSDFLKPGWSSFVKNQSEEWVTMVQYWLVNFGKPVHVLVYENVRKSPFVEMYLLTKFLNLTATFNSLYCLSSGSVGKFYRQKSEWMFPVLLFNSSHRKVVNEKIISLQQKIKTIKNMEVILAGYILPE